MDKELFKAEIAHKRNIAVQRLKTGRDELVKIDEIDQKELDLLDIVIERMEQKINPELPVTIITPIAEGLMIERDNIPTAY